jgi:hypothetical protein
MTHPLPANWLEPEKPSCPGAGRVDHDGWTGAVASLSNGSPQKDFRHGQAEIGTAKSRGIARGTSTAERRIGISSAARAGDAFPPALAPWKPSRRCDRQSGVRGWPSGPPAMAPLTGFSSRRSEHQRRLDGLNGQQRQREREHSQYLRLDLAFHGGLVAGIGHHGRA